MRWIGKTETTKKWFARATLPAPQRQLDPHPTIAYGFARKCTVDDCIGLIKELVKSCIAWGKGEG